MAALLAGVYVVSMGYADFAMPLFEFCRDIGAGFVGAAIAITAILTTLVGAAKTLRDGFAKMLGSGVSASCAVAMLARVQARLCVRRRRFLSVDRRRRVGGSHRHNSRLCRKHAVRPPSEHSFGQPFPPRQKIGSTAYGKKCTFGSIYTPISTGSIRQDGRCRRIISIL